MTVHEIGLAGATDAAIVEAAADRRFAILTQDLDFGRIFVERRPAVTIIVLRARAPDPGLLAALVPRVVGLRLDDAATRNCLFVVGRRGTRIRRRASD